VRDEVPAPERHIIAAAAEVPVPAHHIIAAAAVVPESFTVPTEQHLVPGKHVVTRLGDVLVHRGFVSVPDLERALVEQRREADAGHWVLLGQVLDDWGLTTTAQVDAALVEQTIKNEPTHFTFMPHPSVASRLKR